MPLAIFYPLATLANIIMTKTISKVHRFQGAPHIPGDKSISHRGLIFGALASGETTVLDPLESADVQSTAKVLSGLGVKIDKSHNKIKVHSSGIQNFKSPTVDLDCGNSGTTIRLMMGVLAGSNVEATLFGDVSLSKRPMKRVATPLQKMGAIVSLTNSNYPPLKVKGSPLQGIQYQLEVASAQIKTAIILAALFANGKTTISGEIFSRDHTERLLQLFGASLQVQGRKIEVDGGQKLNAARVQVPGDPSTAAFWMAAASLIPNSKIEMENISLNETRTGFIRALQQMGANVKTEITIKEPESIGKISVTANQLRGISLSDADIPQLIDELPLIAVLATQAKGVTQVSGAAELRVKESDRLEAVAKNIRAMGGVIEVREDGFLIEGPQKLKGARIETFHDHRIAMAFSIAGLVADGNTEIENPECVSVSYPDFYKTLSELTK